MELCVDAGSDEEKMEACDEDADDAMDGSYGPHPAAKVDW